MKRKRRELDDGIERLREGYHMGAWTRGFRPFVTAIQRRRRPHSLAERIWMTVFVSIVSLPLLTFVGAELIDRFLQATTQSPLTFSALDWWLFLRLMAVAFFVAVYAWGLWTIWRNYEWKR